MRLNTEMQAIMSQITKKQGDVLFLGNLKEKEILPFGIPSLDYLTYGGLRYGVSTEFVGDESSGKSTLVLAGIRAFQKREIERYNERVAELEEKLAKAKTDKQKKTIQAEIEEVPERIAVILDLEYTTDPVWLAKNGIDADKVLIYQPTPQGAEEPLDHIIEMASTGQVGFVAVDSVGAMISDSENENDLSKGNYGGISKVLTKYYKKMMPHVNKQNMIHIVVNQTRENMSGFNVLTRPGGKMNKFAQSMVLWLAPSGALDNKYGQVGKDGNRYVKQTIVKLAKNKTSGADRYATIFAIRANYGIDIPYDIFVEAQKFGHIVGSGWYTFVDPKTGEPIEKVQGARKAVHYLEANPTLMETYRLALYEEAIKEEIPENLFAEEEEE